MHPLCRDSRLPSVPPLLFLPSCIRFDDEPALLIISRDGSSSSFDLFQILNTSFFCRHFALPHSLELFDGGGYQHCEWRPSTCVALSCRAFFIPPSLLSTFMQSCVQRTSVKKLQHAFVDSPHMSVHVMAVPAVVPSATIRCCHQPMVPLAQPQERGRTHSMEEEDRCNLVYKVSIRC